MHVLAPAKINLCLRVGPALPNGFHPVMTWMCTVSLFDTLTFERIRGYGIALHCDDAALPCDESNLVAKAAKGLAEATGGALESRPGVRIALQKRIPSGAGLGGGSSDGAAALSALNRLWGAGWDRRRLAELSGKLGSDLPFFFDAPSAVCTGRGEVVRPIDSPAVPWAVLFLPGISMPTPAVYRRFDQMRLGDPGNLTEPDWSRWATESADQLLPRLINDLEPAAFAIRPELAAIRSELEQSLSRIVRMSGSGSSLFTLCDDEAGARLTAKRASELHPVRALPVRLAPSESSSADD
jgi:4-diphosphocytidyl-2-C-methyl-D-erythritol kinase